MKIKDKLYGNIVLDSPVLIELIKSKPLQRLKKISQFGPPTEYYHIKTLTTRFTHSVGVMVLLKKLGATEEEQIAGLLHDISHTAFSHIVDWVLGSGETEEFQNEQHEEFLIKSKVSEILKKYGYNPKKISEHKNFNLLEQDLPDLCADRIDYSTREFPLITARYCLKNMIVYKNKIVFKNKKSALIFAENFLKRQMIHWGGFEAASRYKLFANALKIALNKKIIKFNDFWKDDNFILKKIKVSKNEEINRILTILKKSSLENLKKGKEIIYKKFRYVDPEFVGNNQLIRLSTVSKKFKKELKVAKKINSQGTNLPQVI